MTKQGLTGQNLLYALGAAAAVVLVIALVFIVTTRVDGLVSGEDNWPSPMTMLTQFGFCFGPIVFIITFALLQRFRTDITNHDRD